MLISNYGIHLRSIVRADIERIRIWRNAESVRKNMIHQTKISPALQEKWFSKLNDLDIYLMIENEGIEIGTIHIKDIELKPKTGEAGIFLGENNYRKTHWPIAAILALMDTCFDDFNFNCLYAKTRKNNPETLEMNLALGYEIQQEQAEYYQLKVSPESYRKKSTRLKTQLKAWSNTTEKTLKLSAAEQKLYL